MKSGLPRLVLLCAIPVVVGAWAGCSNGLDDGFGVALTITFDYSVTGTELGSLKSLRFISSGGETATSMGAIGHTANRTEFVIYRPTKGTHEITLLIEALDDKDNVVADGTTPMIDLTPGETTRASVTLVPPGENDLGIDLATDVAEADGDVFDGSFTQVTFKTTPVVPTAAGPVDVAVADFDGDGHNDVAVAAQSAGQVQVFFGNGDGTLQATPSFVSTVAKSPIAIAAADFTKDGKPDIQVLDTVLGNVTLLEYVGNRTFTAQTPVSVSVGADAMVAGDLDGDKLPDLVIGSVVAKLWILYADGTTLTPTVGGSVLRVHLADIDGDGALDIVACEPTASGGEVQILPNEQKTTTHTFGALVTLAASNVIESLAFDFTGDGKTDIWAYTPTSAISNITQFTNMGGFTFSAGVVSAAPDTGGSDYHALAIDFDNDKKIDVLGTAGNSSGLNSEEIAIALAANNSPPVYTKVDTFYSSESGAGAFAAAYMDGDEKLDLVIANQTSNTLAVALGTGSGALVAAEVFAYANHPRFYDFNGDGKLDVGIVSILGGLDLFTGDGKGDLTRVVGIGSAASTQSTVADFDGDKKLDIAVCTSTGTVTIAHGNGDGTFGAPTTTSYGTSFIDIRATDIDHNNGPDLVLLDPTNNGHNVVVLLNNGSGSFSAAQTIGVTNTPLAFIVDDFTGDGYSDVVVLTNDNALTSFVDDTTGQLNVAQRVTTNVSMANGLVALHAGSDAHLDLAVGGNTTQLLNGNGDGTFTTGATVYSQRTNAISAGDVDGDGHDDLVIITDHSFLVLPDAASTHRSFEFAAGAGLDDVAVGNLSRPGFADVIAVGIRPSIILNTTQ